MSNSTDQTWTAKRARLVVMCLLAGECSKSAASFFRARFKSTSCSSSRRSRDGSKTPCPDGEEGGGSVVWVGSRRMGRKKPLQRKAL